MVSFLMKPAGEVAPSAKKTGMGEPRRQDTIAQQQASLGLCNLLGNDKGTQ
jgi:hypothetical protein